MRFYPPNNEEIDLINDKEYLRILLEAWRPGLNLVTRFDITSGKLYHIFMKAERPDIHNGILRVWTQKTINSLYNALTLYDKVPTVFDRLNLLDRVFNRKGKLYSELTEQENLSAYTNMIINAKEHFAQGNYIMASYFAKGAQLYRNDNEASEILEKCRQKIEHKRVA